MAHLSRFNQQMMDEHHLLGAAPPSSRMALAYPMTKDHPSPKDNWLIQQYTYSYIIDFQTTYI